MKTLRHLPFLAAPLFLLLMTFSGGNAQQEGAGARGKDYWLYVGTYTDKAAKGIYAYRFHSATGKTTPVGLVAETPNPSFLAIAPNQRNLYAVNWKGSATVPGDTVSAYRIDPKTGQLTFLNKVSAKGEMPTHLAVDQTGKLIMVVSYGTGTVTALPIDSDGRLRDATYVDVHQGKGPTERQAGPHAHGVALSPDNRFGFVADVGVDQVYSYRLDPAKSTAAAHSPPSLKVAPGTGPRHLAIHPNGKFLYTNKEIQPQVTVFEVSGGNLKEIQTVSALPPDFKGRSSTAEIQIDGAGKFLYVSNRGHDSISVFAVDQSKGTLTPVQHAATKGSTPRNFSLDPTGGFLFAGNQNSDTVVQFRVDPKTGQLTETGDVLQVVSPVCVVFAKAE